MSNVSPTPQLERGLARGKTWSDWASSVTGVLNGIGNLKVTTLRKNLVADYGAVGDGIETTGSITTGTTTLTVGAGMTAARVGQPIVVKGAGASGANLVTTIAGFVSATQCVLATAASATVTNVITIFGTDNTTAIRAAIAAQAASAGFVVDIPDGYYVVAGNYTAMNGTTAPGNITGGPGSATTAMFPFPILLPGTQPVVFGFEGASETSWPSPSITINGNDSPAPRQGAIISAISYPGANYAAVFGQSYAIAQNANAAFHRFRNIIVRVMTDANGVIASAVDLYGTGGTDLRGLRVDTPGPVPGAITQPLRNWTVGIRQGGNNVLFGSNFIERSMSQGYYTGIWLGEHTSGGDLSVCFNNTGIVVPLCYHPLALSRIESFCNIYHLAPAPELAANATVSPRINIQQFDTENAVTGWWQTTKDINDPNNALKGEINFTGITSGSGFYLAPSYVNGITGKNLRVRTPNWTGDTLYDSFQRGSLNPADCGATWLAPAGGWTISPVSGSTMQGANCNGGSNVHALLVTNSGTPEGETEVLIQASPTANATYTGVVFSCYNGGNYLACNIRNDGGTSQVEISRPAGTQVAAWTSGITITPGGYYRLRVRIVNFTVYVYLNGTLVGAPAVLAAADQAFCGPLRGLHQYRAAAGDDGGSRWADFRTAPIGR